MLEKNVRTTFVEGEVPYMPMQSCFQAVTYSRSSEEESTEKDFSKLSCFYEVSLASHSASINILVIRNESHLMGSWKIQICLGGSVPS